MWDGLWFLNFEGAFSISCSLSLICNWVWIRKLSQRMFNFYARMAKRFLLSTFRFLFLFCMPLVRLSIIVHMHNNKITDLWYVCTRYVVFLQNSFASSFHWIAVGAIVRLVVVPRVREKGKRRGRLLRWVPVNSDQSTGSDLILLWVRRGRRSVLQRRRCSCWLLWWLDWYSRLTEPWTQKEIIRTLCVGAGLAAELESIWIHAE